MRLSLRVEAFTFRWRILKICKERKWLPPQASSSSAAALPYILLEGGVDGLRYATEARHCRSAARNTGEEGGEPTNNNNLQFRSSTRNHEGIEIVMGPLKKLLILFSLFGRTAEGSSRHCQLSQRTPRSKYWKLKERKKLPFVAEGELLFVEVVSTNCGDCIATVYRWCRLNEGTSRDGAEAESQWNSGAVNSDRECREISDFDRTIEVSSMSYIGWALLFFWDW